MSLVMSIVRQFALLLPILYRIPALPVKRKCGETQEKTGRQLAIAVSQPGHGEVAHLLTTAVERGPIRLLRARLVQRQKQHAPFSAERFLVARRVPSFAKSFRRQHDQAAATPARGSRQYTA